MLEVVHVVEVLLRSLNFLLQISILLSKVNILIASRIDLLDLLPAHSCSSFLYKLLALVQQVGAVLGLLTLLLELILLLSEVCILERGLINRVWGCVIACSLILHLFLLFSKVGIGLLAETAVVFVVMVVFFVNLVEVHLYVPLHFN